MSLSEQRGHAFVSTEESFEKIDVNTPTICIRLSQYICCLMYLFGVQTELLKVGTYVLQRAT